MSSEDIAEEIRTAFPGTEEVIVQYLAGYLVDDAGEEEDVLQVARELLESLAEGQDKKLEKLMLRLGDLLEDQLRERIQKRSGPKLQKLDKVMDMSKSQMSNTIAFSEGVHLESINKGKCVSLVFRIMSISKEFSTRSEHPESMLRNWRNKRLNSRCGGYSYSSSSNLLVYRPR